MAEDTGLTIRDLVLEVRSDVKEMKEDFGQRLTVLETDATANKEVAKAMLSEKKEVFSKTQKRIAITFALITLFLNVFALPAGPHLFW